MTLLTRYSHSIFLYWRMSIMMLRRRAMSTSCTDPEYLLLALFLSGARSALILLSSTCSSSILSLSFFLPIMW